MKSRDIAPSFLSFCVNEHWFAVPLNVVEGIAPSADVVAIPGNRSRVFIGLTYILGHIMAAVDVAPIFNLGSSHRSRHVIVLNLGGEYYAVNISQPGDIITQPKLQRAPRTYDGIVVSHCEHKKRHIDVIGVRKLIGTYVCM